MCDSGWRFILRVVIWSPTVNTCRNPGFHFHVYKLAFGFFPHGKPVAAAAEATQQLLNLSMYSPLVLVHLWRKDLTLCFFYFSLFTIVFKRVFFPCFLRLECAVVGANKPTFNWLPFRVFGKTHRTHIRQQQHALNDLPETLALSMYLFSSLWLSTV